MPRFFIPTALAWLAGAALAGAAPGTAFAQEPDYGGFTATHFIPFVQNSDLLPFTTPVKLSFQVRDTVVQGVMDTGTTGVMLSTRWVHGYSPTQGEPGWEFLSSSKILWSGRWISQDLTFVDTQGNALATATVPVLAVEREVRCPGYKGEYDGTCPDSARMVWAGPDTTWFCRQQRAQGQGTPCYTPVTRPESLVYVGVGFGREGDGQPGGTPDKNPLLNITAIAGQPVRPGTMRSGYIITPRGVAVGLTSGNTAGFSFMRLSARPVPDSTAPGGSGPSPIPRDWGPATACVSVDGAPCAHAALLIDTGIAQMYLTVPASMPLRTDSIPDPSLCSTRVRALVEGSRVEVRFPGTTTPAPGYAFIVGDARNATAPTAVIIPRDTLAFVNTGRHLYRAFDVLLDADGGYFGVRPIANQPAVPAGRPPCSTLPR